MVQIIGKDSSRVKRTTCGNCTSILEYVPQEVQKRPYRDWDGSMDSENWIVCPCCGSKAHVRAF